MATGRKRLATYQLSVNLHRPQHASTDVLDAALAPTVSRIEEIVKAALAREGHPDATVRAMRTDI